MVVLLICNNEEDPIKNDSARDWDFFSDAQGQLTPQSLVESDRNSLLPESMKKIRSKMKALEC